MFIVIEITKSLYGRAVVLVREIEKSMKEANGKNIKKKANGKHRKETNRSIKSQETLRENNKKIRNKN